MIRALAALCPLLWAPDILACRFNVRDVGFVDLGSSPYKLYCFVDRQTPAQLVSSLKGITTAALVDGNVQPEIVSVDADPPHPALRYLQDPSSGAFPRAVLVAPDDRAFSLELPPVQPSSQAPLWSAIEAIASSPKRTEIQTRVVESYGVILLIDGKDPAANERASQVAHRVIAAVTANLSQLPKTIQIPPTLLKVTAAEAASERVLLWSLGIDPAGLDQPQAAIIYGRGRLVGRVLAGPEIEWGRLKGILDTIGLSCECGLDRSWMQGPMIPLTWDEPKQTKLAGLLGFDPESPLIKMEMREILSKGARANPPSNAVTGTRPAASAIPARAPATSSPPGASDQSLGTSTLPLVAWTWGVIGVLGFVVLLVGLLLFIRRRI